MLFSYKFNSYNDVVRLFSLEIRKFMPLNRRTLIQEENDDFPTFLSHNYEKLEEIGSGAQGKVFKVLEKNSKQVKAIKCMRTRDPELISQVNILNKKT